MTQRTEKDELELELFGHGVRRAENVAGGAREERAISRSRPCSREGGTTRRPTGLLFPRGGIHNSPKIDLALFLSTTTFSSIAVSFPSLLVT